MTKQDDIVIIDQLFEKGVSIIELDEPPSYLLEALLRGLEYSQIESNHSLDMEISQRFQNLLRYGCGYGGGSSENNGEGYLGYCSGEGSGSGNSEGGGSGLFLGYGVGRGVIDFE